MKYFDYVRVIKDRPEYAECNVHAGEVGNIWSAEIRDNLFYVMFETGDEYDFYKYCEIRIEDLEFVKECDWWEVTDERLLAALPKKDPRWWCKVEDGYILNFKGERKNKIPYKYDS
ncbi:MAG: hypothetical protein NC132_04655 [Corallococcus sp.]|nr:hypothetical protein [Corallococcus sp.]MCM1359677.1 hypothetical protein [Corallococcus sp.]MCM1395386.1 hypothetical protein [Corallococcus sp.]